MESVQYWEDSQYDSLVEFDDCMNMVVRDSIRIGEDADDAVIEDFGEEREAIVEDTYDNDGDLVADVVIEDSGEEREAIVEDTYDNDGDLVADAVIEDFDKEREAIVEDTYDNDGDMVEDVVIEDSGESREAIVEDMSVKFMVSESRHKVIHDFDLNELSTEEKLLAAKYKGERDFDLNKLPIAGPKWHRNYSGSYTITVVLPLWKEIQRKLQRAIVSIICMNMNGMKRRHNISRMRKRNENLEEESKNNQYSMEQGFLPFVLILDGKKERVCSLAAPNKTIAKKWKCCFHMQPNEIVASMCGLVKDKQMQSK